MFYLSVFLVKNNFLSSILSTDQKVNDSFSIESKRKEPPDRHVSNARLLVRSKKTLLPWKEKEKTYMYQRCTQLEAKRHENKMYVGLGRCSM